MKKLLLLTTITMICTVLSAQIINVPGDYGTIQEGINAASNGDTVLVANGTWLENICFKGKAITVASEFLLSGDTNDIHNTVIDGSNPIHPDTASVVRFVNGEDTTSIICGFTITRGKGTNMQPFIFYQAGGGILCWNSGAKIISNYIVYDSLLTDIQGIGCGIYGGPTGSDSYVIIENNKIKHNYIYTTTYDYFATGAAIGTDCHCIIRGNEISYNTSIAKNRYASAPINCRGFNNFTRFNSISGNIISHNLSISKLDSLSRVIGGAIYVSDNYGNIFNNVIQYNEIAACSPDGHCNGPGITVLRVDTSFHINNNIISYNKYTDGYLCWGGGLFLWYSAPRVYNNLISYNEATNGGGIAIQDDNPEHAFIVNNTIVNNTGSWGGGIWIYEDSTIILNTIVYNNNAIVNPEILDVFGTTNVNYSDIKGGWLTGEGNIDEDPLFVPGDTLFHLAWSSLCIGAGTETLEVGGTTYTCPSEDFDGEPRPQCVLVDIGADESPFWVGITDQQEQDPDLKLHIDPNPSSGNINISYELEKSSKVSLSITDMSGEILETITPSDTNPGVNTLNFDMSYLPNGLYLIRLQAGEVAETAKVILMK